MVTARAGQLTDSGDNDDHAIDLDRVDCEVSGSGVARGMTGPAGLPRSHEELAPGPATF
jgi:hypothetical protein